MGTEHPTESARTPASNTGDGSNSHKHTALLIDAKAAAAMLALGVRTLWTYTNCRAIPSRKIGRAVRYCPDEVRAWIDSRPRQELKEEDCDQENNPETESKIE